MKSSEGFTIIELVLSIFILSIAVVGIFNAFSIMTTLTSDSADRLTATYLAQEGMEIVRNIRDTNWLNMDFCYANPFSPSCRTAPTWTYGLTTIGACSANTGCEADYTSMTGMLPSFGDYLCINSANGFYYYNSPCVAPYITKFKRKITITPVTDVDGVTDTNMSDMPHVHVIKVTVQVGWDEKSNILRSGYNADYGTSHCGSMDNCITAEGTLYDWYNYINQ